MKAISRKTPPQPLSPERQALVAKWRGLVIPVARRCLGRQLVPEDAIAEGLLGLTIAGARYDFHHESEAKFPTYASFWVRAYVFNWLLENFGPAKFGTTHTDRKVFFNMGRAAGELGLGASDESVAAHLGVSSDVVERVRGYVTRKDVLAEKQDIDGGCAWLDEVMDADEGAHVAVRVREAVAGLPERERFVIRKRYLAGETLARVGARLGVSRERVRQIEIKALDKLRSWLEDVEEERAA